MEEHTETWHLLSGTWCRDPALESWRLAAAPNGTVAHARLSGEDAGRLIAASRDPKTGQWFPSDFNYSPRTGAPLHITIPSLDSPWVPPFGAPALSDIGRSSTRGLKQTTASLALIRSRERLDPAADADRTLPALPHGQYRFLVHKFDVASPTLMAIEPQYGNLLVLLPESKVWIPLEHPTHGVLAQGLMNWRGWRMEVIKGKGRQFANLYFATAGGLAVVTPTLIGLSYTVEYFGQGTALGGPVAWAGEVWAPVRSDGGVVRLVGKPPGAAQAIVLETSAPAPEAGFEAPVFDLVHVIWPSEEGQLVLRLDQDGRKKTDWIAWPDGARPAFSLGCPYQSLHGFFWQPCWRDQSGSLEYVEMGTRGPERVAVDAPRLCTGHISFRRGQRIVGDPWREPVQASNGASTHIVVPLIESELERAVVGLRIDAPHGVLAVLESGKTQRAVLQLQADTRADVLFGTLNVARPWMASLFIYDAHLWVYHPELPQALGWKLFN